MKGRILAILCVAVLARGDALDDAVGQWAKKISAHLAADEVAHVTWMDPGTADTGAAAYLTRAKALLARGLQRRLRSPKPVDVTARLAQNLKGYLLIAEIHHDDETAVEMASVARPPAAPTLTTGFRLERRLLWEQETTILDASTIADSTEGDQMLVLDTSGLTRYEQHGSNWQKADGATLEIPPTRDPRGRITVAQDTVTVEVPGSICRGNWKPRVSLECQPGGRFTAGRNTIEEESWPPFFSHAEIQGDHVIAETDGRTIIYDAARKEVNVSATWNDFAVVANACTSAKLITSDAASNLLAVFDLVKHVPVRVSDSMEMAGPVTAIWPAGSTAVAVIRNKGTNRYEAYSLGVACGR